MRRPCLSIISAFTAHGEWFHRPPINIHNFFNAIGYNKYNRLI